MKDKKGQVIHIGLVMVVLFASVVSILVVTYVLDEFFTEIDNSGLSNAHTNQTRDIIKTSVPATFDYTMLVVVVLLTLGLVITSFLIPSHPVFLVINIFGIFVLGFTSMAVSNMFGEMVAGENAVFGTVAESYPISVYIMNYLPWITVIIVLLTTIVMYAKWRSG